MTERTTKLPFKIPPHWQVLRLKHVASLKSGEAITAETIEPEGGFPVYGGNGIRGFSSSYTHDGHFVLIGRQGALCGNVNYAKGKFWASEHAVVVTPKRQLAVRWLGELLRSMNLNQYSLSAAQPGLAVERIGELTIPFPPLAEQRRLAAFLESALLRVDSLIQRKKRQVDLLQEKLQAIITEAVTMGLDPNAQTKDTGAYGVGRIPSKWEMRRAKHVGTAIIGLTYAPEDVVSEADTEDTYLVLRASNVQEGRLSFEDCVYVRCSIPDELAIRKGDILICARSGSRNLVGKSAMISESYRRMTFGAFMTVFRSELNDFLSYFFASDCFKYQATGFLTTTINQLTNENLNNVLMPIPPIQERSRIVEYLKEETEGIEQLVTSLRRSIGLLEEYRSSVTAAAVSGQLDISRLKNGVKENASL